jgi:LuxR family transcriptional regulator, maltose regulon positive regulatory protein
VQIGQGRPEEAEAWVQRAERTVTEEAAPAARLAVHYFRGRLELGRGRDADALAAFRAAERLAERLDAPNLLLARARAMLMYSLVRLGDTERAEQILASFGDQERERGEIRTAAAALRLAQDDPRAATAVLAPVLDGSASGLPWGWLPHAFLLEAIAQDALGDPAAAGRALERALDLAEPDGALFLFLLDPAPGLLERHAQQRTAHAALVAEILSLLGGQTHGMPPGGPRLPLEPLSDSEIRVLRYLPTNLSMPEIANELYVSLNTVRTHMRHLYIKLGTHRRADTFARARALGLLAPSPLKPRD